MNQKQGMRQADPQVASRGKASRGESARAKSRPGQAVGDAPWLPPSLMKLDLRSLRQFVVVARELHFARAARMLDMAQPPLSQAIAKLEDRLNVRLFDRSKRQVKLTQAGVYLQGEAQRLLARAGQLQDAMHAIAQGEAGKITVGYNATAIHGFLAPLLKRFVKASPDLKLTLRELTSDQQIEAVRAQALDVGFVRLFGDDHGLSTQVVHSEKYVLAVPSRHRLAKKRMVKLSELEAEPMVRFPRDSSPSYMDSLQHFFHSQGLVMQTAIEATSGYANTALVAAGLGVALAPQSLARWPYPGVVYRPFAQQLPVVRTHMVWAEAQPSPPIARFVAFIRSHMRPLD